jgi:hypothetical protein
MLAPSGAGGAYFTELLDDNWSIEGTQNKDNNRCSKTNEYAGSPNSFRIDDYKLHVKFNDFPDWNENTILLGKRFSPVEFFKNHCDCPITYIINPTGQKDYIDDLVFFKKVTANSCYHMTPYFMMMMLNRNQQAYEKIFWSVPSNQEKIQSWNNFQQMLKSISEFLDPLSTIALKYFALKDTDRYNWNASDFLNHLHHEYQTKTYAIGLKEYEILDSNIAELEQYTKVKVVSYEDLLKGHDTNTEFDNYKSQLAKYFTKNTELLDQFFLDIDLC